MASTNKEPVGSSGLASIKEGNTSSKKPKIFFPNLDGLRFYCFIAVFLMHAFASESNNVSRNRTYIFIQNYSDRSWFKFQNNRFITYTGKLTYGLYCLHMIGILVVVTIMSMVKVKTNLGLIVFVQVPLSFALAWIIAWLSFNLFEKRFLNLKDKFAFITKH